MLKRKLKSAHVYYRAIGLGGLFFCTLDAILRRGKLRKVAVGGTEVYVRTNTGDLSVAMSSLFHGEYDNIRCLNPKYIIDAGAYIGTTAIYFANRYPHSKIIAVEPEDGNFSLLKMNASTYPNIVVLRAALWGTAGSRIIRDRLTGHWGYTISETSNRTESTGQEIDCLTISDIMEQYNIDVIDLLKMDIEGSEKDVLENSSDWIDSVRIITVELHDRICTGCDRAFSLATRDFVEFEKHGEKVTAYRS